MKKIALGIVWFIAIWFGTLIIGSAIVGGIAGSKVNATTISEGYEKGQIAGREAGTEFGRKYGGMILVAAFLIAIGGTVSGVLPGTKSRDKSLED